MRSWDWCECEWVTPGVEACAADGTRVIKAMTREANASLYFIFIVNPFRLHIYDATGNRLDSEIF